MAAVSKIADCESQKMRLRNLLRQFGLPAADEAAMLRSIADERSDSPRVAFTACERRKIDSEASPDAIRKRRQRVAEAAGLQCVRGNFYLNKTTLNRAVELGHIPREAADNDLDLLDAIADLLDRAYWR